MIMVKGEDRNGFEVCKVGGPRLCVCGVARCAKNYKSVVMCLGIHFTWKEFSMVNICDNEVVYHNKVS